MTRRLRLADAARAIRPYEQGDLDSLCGLYTVINAVRVAVHPHRRISKPQSLELFVAGLRALSRSRKLLRGLTVGIDEPTLDRVCDAVIAEANRVLGVELITVRPRLDAEWSSAAALRFMRSHLRAGAPVIVGFEGQLDHWTVVVRSSATRLSFFDSSALHWVPIAAVCLVDDGSGKRHPITDNGVFAIALATKQPAVEGSASTPQRRIRALRKADTAR